MRLDEIINACIKQGDAQQALKDTSGNSRSYLQLQDEIAAHVLQISSRLQSDKKNVLAIVSERNIFLPALLYAVVNSGAAYVPIDHRFPAERISTIVNEARPNAAIVQNKYREIFESACDCEIASSLALSEEHTLLVLAQEPVGIPADAVYILYTSGSTGVPKGAIHTHSSVVSFLQWCSDAIDCSDASTFISISPLQFDLSVFDLFFPLFRTGTLLLVKEAELANHRMLAQIIAGQGVNCVYATPSFFRLLCTGGKLQQYSFDHVSHLLLAGEALQWQLLHDMKPYFTKAQCYNLYGPTETNVCCYYKVNEADERLYPVAVPIGKPCGETKIHLEASDDPSMPELWVAGGTLMHGYVAGPASFRMLDDVRYYNTGDLVQQEADGNLVFCGRRDRMIKKNGFRVEPAEVEKYIRQLEGVHNAVAAPVVVKNSMKLVIFIQSDKVYNLLEIKQYCLSKLPYYMVPDDVIMVQDLPLNLNNKTDIGQLVDNYVK
ncbi:MAG: AMP-binding protein [Bacteroidetes bacterium]|nr:AMP-binding protein [Bacteroidota bacterium]